MHTNSAISANPTSDLLSASAELVIGAAHEVSKRFGSGFLEEVYGRALTRALVSHGLRVESRLLHNPSHDGQYRECVAVLLIDSQLLVEIKCVECVSPECVAECIKRLGASRLKLALLLNFRNAKVEWKRILPEERIRMVVPPMRAGIH